jgi:diguanylate cyclase
MTTTTPLESTSRSKELLKDAISFIGIHRLSASPVNYSVCYEYFLGSYPSLNKAVDEAISKNTPLTDPMMRQWFETFLSSNDQIGLRQSQADLIDVISKMAESALLAETNVNQFNKVLQHSEKELADSASPLESIIAHLLTSTRTMQASMELMKQQIHESKEEINSLQERLESVTEEALSDSLTGLTNRKGLSKAIEKALSGAAELNSYPCLLMMDIDYFKKINDSFGHLLGDRVIKAVGETLKSQIKGKDTAARYGGEEFCVLLPETELKDAVKVAENIRLAVERTRIKRSSDNQEICRMTISVGVTRYNPDESITSMLERADNALYRSKNEGRNRVTFLAG